MKILFLFLLLALCNAESTKEPTDGVVSTPQKVEPTTTLNTPVIAPEEQKESNDIAVKPLGASKVHKLHPLPPVAISGIVKDFGQAVKIRAKRNFLSELRLLKKQYLPLERTLNRIKRSLPHPKPIAQIPSLINRRSQRDLRRLRRDLGYDTTPDFMVPSSYPQMTQPSVYGQTSKHVPTTLKGKELDRLLHFLTILEQLAFMNQEKDFAPPSVASTNGQQRRVFHAPPSRFAPQPKIFYDDPLNHRPYRGEDQQTRMEIQPEDLMWIPEKRMSRPRASLSMIPGFKKRSVFREAAKSQLFNQRTKRERQKNVSSWAAFLGSDSDSLDNNFQQTVM